MNWVRLVPSFLAARRTSSRSVRSIQNVTRIWRSSHVCPIGARAAGPGKGCRRCVALSVTARRSDLPQATDTAEDHTNLRGSGHDQVRTRFAAYGVRSGDWWMPLEGGHAAYAPGIPHAAHKEVGPTEVA